MVCALFAIPLNDDIHGVQSSYCRLSDKACFPSKVRSFFCKDTINNDKSTQNDFIALNESLFIDLTNLHKEFFKSTIWWQKCELFFIEKSFFRGHHNVLCQISSKSDPQNGIYIYRSLNRVHLHLPPFTSLDLTWMSNKSIMLTFSICYSGIVLREIVFLSFWELKGFWSRQFSFHNFHFFSSGIRIKYLA